MKGGLTRLGETIEMTKLDGSTMQVKIVDPVFYDKEGEKQNV